MARVSCLSSYSHMSPIYRKSTLARLTSETSAVVWLGFAQTGRWGQSPHTSKKSNAVAMTTAVDHGKMSFQAKASLAWRAWHRIEGEGVCPSEALQNSFPPCRFIKEPLQNMSFFLGCGDCTSQMPAITIG